MSNTRDTAAIRFIARELCRAWDRVAPIAQRRVVLNERTGLGLVFCCQAWGQYALLLEAAKRWPKDRVIGASLERARQTARDAAADFHLLEPGRRRLAVLSRTGEDAELLRLFGKPQAPSPMSQVAR
jgi:hypothetical protein